MTTATALTLFFAKAIGLYMIAAGIGGFTSAGRWRAILEEMKNQTTLVLFGGILAYLVGIAMVLTHNVWTDPLAIAVSIVGWLALLKGLVLLCLPDPLMNVAHGMARPGASKVWSLFAIAVGALFLYGGIYGAIG